MPKTFVDPYADFTEESEIVWIYKDSVSPSLIMSPKGPIVRNYIGKFRGWIKEDGKISGFMAESNATTEFGTKPVIMRIRLEDVSQWGEMYSVEVPRRKIITGK